MSTNEPVAIDVPVGWECLPLDQLVESSRGISYGIVQPGQHDVGGIPIVRVNNVRNGRIEAAEVLRVSGDVESKYERTACEAARSSCPSSERWENVLSFR